MPGIRRNISNIRNLFRNAFARAPAAAAASGEEDVIDAENVENAVNDENVQNVINNSVASTPSKYMLEYPFALEWTIAENHLFAFKDATNNALFRSETFTPTTFPNVTYCLDLFPNGCQPKYRGLTMIFLRIEFEDGKKFDTEYSFSVETANWTRKYNYNYSEREGRGDSCCTTEELFDPSKKFIVDGKFTIKVEGFIKIEKAEPTPKILRNFSDLWKIGFEDFTITAADKKEIKVHKNVISAHSPVFYAMLNSGMKESIENKVEIIDFPFKTIEKAVEICYLQTIYADLSMNEIALLIKFADKYDVAIIQDAIENFLGDKITAENVCETANFAIATNCFKLQKQCMKFFIKCLFKKEMVPKIELLDKDFSTTLLNHFACRACVTL
uniref:BTB domain-containing protein n=1 Tax=Panagrolaimus sp. ES5 TaxID=591445 RepID=A0AC34FY33_9BILA